MKTKDELPACPVATAVSLIGGKWKLLILRNLKSRPWRFNELQRDLDGISQKVLTDSLRQMIEDGLAYRHDYQVMPPRVEYGLTALGKEMLPIIDALADFGNYYKSQMIEDGLAYRHDYQVMPPRVEYGLTALGKEMLPIIDALADFGNYYKSVIRQQN